MSNRLDRVTPEVRRLSPAEAEVWIVITAEKATPTTEVRGRVVGPRCPGVTTVEVAYPLRPFSPLPEEVPPLTRRVVIPDPSLWEVERPFVYHAIVELWQDGQRCDQAELDYGLRMTEAVRRPDGGC